MAEELILEAQSCHCLKLDGKNLQILSPGVLSHCLSQTLEKTMTSMDPFPSKFMYKIFFNMQFFRTDGEYGGPENRNDLSKATNLFCAGHTQKPRCLDRLPCALCHTWTLPPMSRGGYKDNNQNHSKNWPWAEFSECS